MHLAQVMLRTSWNAMVVLPTGRRTVLPTRTVLHPVEDSTSSGCSRRQASLLTFWPLPRSSNWYSCACLKLLEIGSSDLLVEAVLCLHGPLVLLSLSWQHCHSVDMGRMAGLTSWIRGFEDSLMGFVYRDEQVV